MDGFLLGYKKMDEKTFSDCVAILMRRMGGKKEKLGEIFDGIWRKFDGKLRMKLAHNFLAYFKKNTQKIHKYKITLQNENENKKREFGRIKNKTKKNDELQQKI
jgi:hypothetical protein